MSTQTDRNEQVNVNNLGPHTSFQQLLWQLQFTFSPKEYRDLIEEYRKSNKMLWENIAINEYWLKLPSYTIAQCPFCNAKFLSALDTHGIYQWHTSLENHRNVFVTDQYQNVGCDHFIAVQTFFNLNGCMPVEMKYFQNQCGDIPVILVELFLEDIRTEAVIHSLPICYIENNRFTPRYSIYTVTYYGENGVEMRRRHEIFARMNSYRALPYFYPSNRMRKEPQVADLPYWVEKKRLHWLDIRNRNLPLKSGPVHEFPYAGIQGYGCAFTYQRKPRPQSILRRLFWNEQGKILCD